MAEALAREVARLQLEVQSLQAQLQTRAAATKDLSLVPLVPKWSGKSKSISVQDFLDTIESAASVGKWTDEDMILIATLKLTDTARTFYIATPELHAADITWPSYKSIFLQRFKDTRTDQFHFCQLQSSRQRKDESPLDFTDRCKALARNIVPQVADPATQKIYNEQADRMLLASYAVGLLGTPVKQVRYALPGCLEEAVEIAVPVDQADQQDHRSSSFYTGKVERVSVRSPAPSDESSERARASRTVRLSGTSHTPEPDNAQHSRRPVSKHGRRCYECEGIGHLARDCPTRRSRRAVDGAQDGRRIEDTARSQRASIRDGQWKPQRPNRSVDQGIA
jgi:hypothetical protein